MRAALKILLYLLLPCGVFSQVKRPNILWITIEDTSPQFIGCYGNKIARTPVIDKLAREGVKFSNAFSTNTVCSPSRATLITGVRTIVAATGHHRSKFPIPEFIHGFPSYLREAGYYTSNNSKTDYNVKNPERLIRESWNESSNVASWQPRKPGQPFFAVFNFMDSHQSRTMTDSYEDYVRKVKDHLTPLETIDENAFPMPPFLHDSKAMRKQFARVYNSISLTDKKIGVLLDKLQKDKLLDSTIIFFFADHGEAMPRGKTNGINLGYRVPFVIWFPEMYRERSPWKIGSTSKELIDFEDLAPTVIDLAGGNIPTYIKGRKLLSANRPVEKKYLLLSSDRADNGPDMVRSITNGRYLYSRNFMPFLPEARYIRYVEISDIKQQMRSDFQNGILSQAEARQFGERPAEFLFDIDNDPWELNNLAKDKEQQIRLQKMRAQLKSELISQRDIMLLPEYELAKISESTTPYEFRMTPDYHFEKIYAAAQLSGFRDSRTFNQQLSLLNDKENVVRYWAITGIHSADKIDARYLPLIRKAMDDPYPPVQVTASAILYQMTKDNTAFQHLLLFAQDKNPHIALMAINFMLYFKDKVPFIETIQKIYTDKKGGYDVIAACADLLGATGKIPNTPEYEQ